LEKLMKIKGIVPETGNDEENTLPDFGGDVICSDPKGGVDTFLKETLRFNKTMKDFSMNHGAIVYISCDMEYSEVPGLKDTRKWALVDLKAKCPSGEQAYYLAKWDSSIELYDGHLVGDLTHLTNGWEYMTNLRGSAFFEAFAKFQEYLTNDKKATPAATTRKEHLDKMTDEIFDSLLINNWCSINGFARFIRIAGSRLKELRDMGANKYYVENKARYAVINTGLIDKYKEDVYIMYQWNETNEIYSPYCQMKGKSDWVENGFTVEQASAGLRPLRFWEAADALGEIGSGDMDIPARAYEHIIEDNRERMEAVIGTG
jgi:hypothetical protein